MAVIIPIPGVDVRALLVDGTGVPIGGSNPLLVSGTAAAGQVSTVNSTATPLAGGATFTGTGEDVLGYSLVVVEVLTDQLSAANGLKLQFSTDNTNWDFVVSNPGFNIGTNELSQGLVMTATPAARYFRVVYTNGATPQTAFRLQTIYKTGAVPHPYQVFNPDNGSFQYIRSANGMTDGFGGGAQPGFVAAIRSGAATHDVMRTIGYAKNTTGTGLAAAGIAGLDTGGVNYQAVMVNTDGSLPVGGFTKTVSATLTRAANQTPYASGDEMTDTGGAILTLTGMARLSGGTGTIYNISLNVSSNSATKPTLEVWLFDTTSTPQTDNTAFAPADGVIATVIPGGIVPLTTAYVGDATSTTGNFVMTSGPLNIPYTCVGSANLYARFVLRAAYTAGSNSDTYLLRIGVGQD